MTTSAAEGIATESCWKMLSAETGLFREIKLTPIAVTIGDDGIRNTESVHWAKVAPKVEEVPTEDNSTKSEDYDAERSGTHAGDTEMEEKSVAHAPRNYVVDRVVPHVRKSDIVRYVVRWNTTLQLTICWYHLSTFLSFASCPICAESGNKLQGYKERQMEIGDNKECTPFLHRWTPW